IISINSTESLSLSELKHGLKLAIQRGLKLAIFNSCDGLGLAKELENLGIPQVIIMREPVPDQVAQNFLKYFLDEFSQGQSIYIAVRRARERLHDDGWELKIPGATWLPIICQNPATKPLVWPGRKKNRKFILTASILVLTLICSVAVFKGHLLKKISESYPQQAQKVVYKNEAYGLKINYPQTWQQKKIEIGLGSTMARFIPKEMDELIRVPEVNIQANEYENIMKLDNYTKKNIEEIVERSDTRLLTSITSTILADREARKLIYTEFDGTIKVMEIWTLRGKTIYAIKYSAPINLYDQFVNDVDAIVNSFELN
ncbi:MAG: PsbP-related protein, partial [Bacteroidota bacterium]